MPIALNTSVKEYLKKICDVSLNQINQSLQKSRNVIKSSSINQISHNICKFIPGYFLVERYQIFVTIENGFLCINRCLVSYYEKGITSYRYSHEKSQ